MVFTNNINATSISENCSSGVKTMHINTIYHFIREHIEDGFIKTFFVRIEENDAGIFTKDVI